MSIICELHGMQDLPPLWGLGIFLITERDSLQARAEQFNKVFNKLPGRGSQESLRVGHKGEPGICSACTEQQQLSAPGRKGHLGFIAAGSHMQRTTDGVGGC